MNPAETPRRDWRLYYQGTMMMHDTLGVVSINVEERNMYIRPIGDKLRGDWKACDASLLTCLWPNPKAINWKCQGLYIGRRARREARRSFTSHHYYIAWGAGSPHNMIHTMLPALLEVEDYPPLDIALEQLQSGQYTSVAISRDIIIGPELEVIARGIEAGRLLLVEGEYRFDPELARSPLARRAAFKLAKEGVICL